MGRRHAEIKYHSLAHQTALCLTDSTHVNAMWPQDSSSRYCPFDGDFPEMCVLLQMIGKSVPHSERVYIGTGVRKLCCHFKGYGKKKKKKKKKKVLALIPLL